MFGFGRRKAGTGKEGPLVIPVLRRISDEQTVVRMEMERVMLRFNTRLALRDQVVLVGKPSGLEESIEKGDCARIKVPWAKNFEVRMFVTAHHVNLKNGSEGFICKTPSGHALPVKRSKDRFNTRRFSNLQLLLPSFGLDFPIMDLSAEGCRIKARPEIVADLFKMNREIMEGVIQVGERFHIALETMIPRAFLRETVGLEFNPRQDSGHKRNLSTLLGTLAMQEVHTHAPDPIG